MSDEPKHMPCEQLRAEYERRGWASPKCHPGTVATKPDDAHYVDELDLLCDDA